MTIEKLKGAENILRRIKYLEICTIAYEREIYGDGNSERVRRHFRACRRSAEKEIEDCKRKFEKL
jgi:hypothetical protein